MRFSRLLAVGVLPQLPYALHIPIRRGVDCGFSTSASSGATCESFAGSWGLTVDTLEALNPGIRCPDIETDAFCCVVGSFTNDEPSATGPSSTVNVSIKAQLSSTINTAKSTTTSKPSPTKPSGNGIETPSLIQDSMVPNCNKFHHVQSTTTCKGILDYNHIKSTTTCQGVLTYNKITMEQSSKWNPTVKKDCSGLWKGIHACVGVA